jgi:hypothetical protein
MLKNLDAAVALVVVITLASACRERDATAAPRTVSEPATVSVPTIESELARFRSGMTEPTSLAGPPSRDSLVRLFERALVARDSAALDRLQITREEFAYLYYPDSKMAQPPYELGPDVMWMQIQSQRYRGLRRLIAKFADRSFRIRGLECDPAQRQNAVVIHQCGVRTSGAVAAKPERLFGSIIERHGRFKFVGYANRL